MSAQPGLSFRGCGSRADALQRLAAFLDEQEDVMVREFGSRLIMDGAVTTEDISRQIADLRSYLATNRAANRADVLAVVERAFDEGLLGNSEVTHG